MEIKIKFESMCRALCDWLIKGTDNDVFLKTNLAQKIKSIRQEWGHPKADEPVYEKDVSQWISLVRADMELRYKKTLRWIPRVYLKGRVESGWKIANPSETAVITAKWVKRTILYADRTGRLLEITDRKYIPGAIKEVFEDNGSRLRVVSKYGKKFVNQFGQYLIEQKKEEKERNLKNEKTTKAVN